MSKTRSAGVVRKVAAQTGDAAIAKTGDAAIAETGDTAIAEMGDAAIIDLERYVPALITFIANKLSRSATALYQRRFHVNVTEWRILVLLTIEPGIPAARICHVIGFDKGPVSRTLSVMQERGLVTIKTDPKDGRTHSISLASKGREIHDQIIGIALDRERRLLSCLSAAEQEVLIGLLGRVHGNLAAVTEHPENRE